MQDTLSGFSGRNHERQKEKRRQYFLGGRTSFGWIEDNIPDPTSRLILVARAFMDMEKRDSCVLDTKVFDCAGIVGRGQRARVLKRLREADPPGLLLETRKGRRSVLWRVDY